MRHPGFAFLLLLPCVVTVAMCNGEHATVLPNADAAQDGAPDVATRALREPTYSAFVVEIADAPFDEVSFKDVGLNLSPELHTFAYESLAESLRAHLEADGWDTTIRHDPSQQNAHRHLACEGRHIYVDLWHTEQPDGWAYSLWSGCDEQSLFGEGQTSIGGNIAEGADELAASIAAQLRSASEDACFSLRC